LEIETYSRSRTILVIEIADLRFDGIDDLRLQAV